MSIFTKDCPHCGETSSASTNSCQCGYIFEAVTDSLEAVEQVSQEEEVYEAYLAARLDQARIAAEKAIELLTQDPMDKAKAAEADQANSQLSEINAEYENQLEALDQAQEEAESAKALAEAEQARLNAEAQLKAAKYEEQVRKTRELEAKRVEMEMKKTAHLIPQTAQADQVSVPRPLAPPRIVSLSSKAVSTALAMQRPIQPLSPQRAVTRARSGQTRYDATAAVRSRRAAQDLITQRAEACANKRSGQANMPAKLREATRQQAEQIVVDARHSTANISGDLAAAAKALDSRMSHLNSGALSKPSASSQECPNCTAQLAGTAKQCSCGYRLSEGSESMPELSLKADDLRGIF